jgi:hypothetical protein
MMTIPLLGPLSLSFHLPFSVLMANLRPLTGNPPSPRILGSDLLVDFDLMMTIPLLGPFFLTMTQLSMPWVLRFLYTAKF